jgi:hypothetical protein
MSAPLLPGSPCTTPNGAGAVSTAWGDDGRMYTQYGGVWVIVRHVVREMTGTTAGQAVSHPQGGVVLWAYLESEVSPS